MSLVSHLNSATSPVNIYFQEHFKGLSDFLKADSKVIDVPDVIVPTDKNGYPWGIVGHMAEYLFQINLGLKVQMLYPMRILARANSTPAKMLYNKVIMAFKAPVDVNNVRFVEQCNALYSLASLEHHWRADAVVFIQNNKVSEAVLLDLMNLWECSLKVSPYYGIMDKYIYNPEFSLSPVVGGADADFIKVSPDKKQGNTLVDMKLTIIPEIKNKWIYQLLGYYFLDKNGYYKIKNLEIFLPRQNSLLRWTVDELIIGASDFESVRRAKAGFMSALKDIPAANAMNNLIAGLK